MSWAVLMGALRMMVTALLIGDLPKEMLTQERKVTTMGGGMMAGEIKTKAVNGIGTTTMDGTGRRRRRLHGHLREGVWRTWRRRPT